MCTTHASRVDRKTATKNAAMGYATRDGHMTKVPDCSEFKKYMIKYKYVAL